MDDAHILIPPSLELPPLYATEHTEDPVVQLKFFTPDGSWTWYLTEFDPEDRIAFGLVSGHETELGYFSIDELESVRGPAGLKIERDIWFEPTKMSEIRKSLERGWAL